MAKIKSKVDGKFNIELNQEELNTISYIFYSKRK